MEHDTNPPLRFSQGAGKMNARDFETVEVPVGDAGPAVAFRDALDDLPPGLESWIAPGIFDDCDDRRRKKEFWRSTQILHVDVDYYTDGEHAFVPPELVANVEFVLSLLPGSVAHLTPRGFRVFFVLDCEDADFERVRDALHKTRDLVAAAIQGVGELAGFKGDESASHNVAGILWAPRAEVGGVQREAEVLLIRAEPYALDDLLGQWRELDLKTETTAPALKPAAPSKCFDAAGLADILSYIDPCCGYDQWRNIGMALRFEFGDAAFEVWDEWSMGCMERYPNTRDPMDQADSPQPSTQEKWESFADQGAGPNGYTFNTVLFYARQGGTSKGPFKGAYTGDRLLFDDLTDGGESSQGVVPDRTDWSESSRGVAPQRAPKPLSPFAREPRPLDLTNPPEPPPPLLLRPDGQPYMLRGTTKTINATGGTGKTFMGLQLAVAVATKGKWLGHYQVAEDAPSRVFLAVAEEHHEECRRRLWTICEDLRLSSEDREAVIENVEVYALAGKPTPLMTEAGPTHHHKALLERLAAGTPWALVVLDPQSRFTGIEAEASNEKATRFIQEIVEPLTRVPGNPAALVMGHSSKESGRAGKADARGVTGLRDGYRAAALVYKDAGKNGAEPRLKLEHNKSNGTPTDRPHWLKRLPSGLLMIESEVGGQEDLAAQEAKEAERKRVKEEENAKRKAKAIQGAAAKIEGMLRGKPEGATKQEVEGVGGSKARITAALRALLDEGRVENRGKGNKHEYHLVDGADLVDQFHPVESVESDDPEPAGVG